MTKLSERFDSQYKVIGYGVPKKGDYYCIGSSYCCYKALQDFGFVSYYIVEPIYDKEGN